MSETNLTDRRSQLTEARRALLEKRLSGKHAEPSEPQTIPRRASQEPAPLSFAQQRLWFMQQLDAESFAYNIPVALRLTGRLNTDALEQSVNEIVRRHESLRTIFRQVEGQPLQVILPELRLRVRVIDLQYLPEALREAEALRLSTEEARRPFDLEAWPLVRVHVLRLRADEHTLLFVIHHIVSDGWSMGVLVNEVATLYAAHLEGQASPLTDLPIQYADFSKWQRNWLTGEALAEQLRYWKRQLGGALPVLGLPTTRPHPARQSFRGAIYSFDFSPELSASLKAMCRQEGVTLFMLAVAALQTLLHRYTQQTDIVIGTAIANRNRAEIEGLIGFFVNTLALRTNFSGDPTFREVLRRVRDVTLGAYAHQDLPFEKLVEELQPDRSINRNPFFDVAIGLQNAPMPALELPGLTLRSQEFESPTTRFDLEFHLWDLPEGVRGNLSYSTDLFDEPAIARLLRHFQQLLETVVVNADERVSAIQLLTAGERWQLLVEWNETGRDFPRESCVHELFEAQAQATPDAIALIHAGQRMTYAELNSRANQLAHDLRAEGVVPEMPVGLCVERSFEMVVGILGILKAGGAYVPLDAGYPAERLSFMLRDAGVRVLLTQERLLENLPARDLTILCLDRDWPRIAERSDANPTCTTTPDNLIYLIYTSGSTGQPKGVAVVHSNVVRLVKNTNYLPFDAAQVYLQLSTLNFDASTLEIWGALLNGARLVIPDAAQPSLAELGRMLSENEITTVFLTTGLFHLLVDEQLEQLGCVKHLVIGGEVLSVKHARRVLETLPESRFLNVYGPTENTTLSCWHEVKLAELGEGRSVPIGTAISHTQIYVLDERMEPVPVGVRGELYLSGDGVARGYLNRPELTAEKFVPDAFSKKIGARLYRTGDVVRFLEDGKLEFIGRRDSQVKVRGFRVELGEIEAALLEHEEVKEAVVIAREDVSGSKSLTAYVVPANAIEKLRDETAALSLTMKEHEIFGLNAGNASHALQGAEARRIVSRVRAFLDEKLPPYMIPASFVLLDALPFNSSGKVDKKALPAPDETQAASFDEAAQPRTAVEELVSHLWTEVLGRESVRLHDDFFELGGHSLLATKLISRVRESFKAELPLRVLFEAPTVAQFSAHLEAALREQAGVAAPPLVPVRRDENLPLSFAQQRLWFLSQLEPTSSFYNMPAAVRLSGTLDADAMRRTLNEIVRRHESLRTSFPAIEGKPRQAIAESLELELPLIDISGLPAAERETEALRRATAEARHPFDLAHGPLFRASLLRLQTDEHILLATMHHIISDGWSMGVLVREVGELYRAFTEGKSSPLPELPIQYADFSAWQREWLTGAVFERHLAYWKKQLGGELPQLDLLTDKPRPQVQSFRGASESIVIPESLLQSLHLLCKREGATLFMVLLAAFKILLFRHTGQADVAVGSPIANRTRLETENLIGFFVNTLVMRTDLAGDPSFSEVVRRVRAVTLEAYAHQDLPFEQLVEAMQPERSMSRNPLFQVMFQMQNTPQESLPLRGLKLSSLEVEHVTSQFDLSLDVLENEEGLRVVAEYSTDLFDAHTIVALLHRWLILLDGIVGNPESRISELPLLPDWEREQLLVRWNETTKTYPRAESLHTLFEAQVEETPDAVALVAGDERLSYRELNGRANKLAHTLRAAGVCAETTVGIFLDRSAEMIVTLLAILKAGGAYVPLEPTHPQARLAFMLDETRMRVVVTDARLATKLPPFQGRVIRVDESRELIEQQSEQNPSAFVSSGNAAYVLYTSGSTGQPKGVIVSHAALINHSFAVARAFALEPQDRVLQFASLSFDVAAEEVFPTLLNGAAIVLRGERLLESATLLELIEREKLTTLNLPAPFWQEWTRELALLETPLPPTLRLVIVGSDKVSTESFIAWHKLYPQATLINAYGTSETTITNTLYQAASRQQPAAHYQPATREELPNASVPIGRPLDNTRIYLLDESLQPVPTGVAGELYIGGDALARGYLHRPALTAERFIPDPFDAAAGARMYRTGDRARYLQPDGQLEFLGRVDRQVKLRGYRIELGEIETRLRLHPSVREAVVVARAGASDDQRLVAYVTQNPAGTDALDTASLAALEEEQLANWQAVHDDEVFNEPATSSDPAFNISGWNSSYTSLPIPAAEMREWVEDAVEHIKAQRPRRVLEIGCGTGLLLFRLAPSCESYVGTDFSHAALDYVRRQLKARDEKLKQVALLERRADDFGEIETENFDMVILNSVVQYFPSVEYLLQVLEGAVAAVTTGGSIFIGDVRSLPLLETFHATVELHRAEASLSLAELRRLIRNRVAQEEELALAPAFFDALRRRLPRISHVEIIPKRGQSQNEMTRFRYQVLLHVGKKISPATPALLDWKEKRLDWKEKQLDLNEIRRMLKDETPEALCLTDIPNARISEGARALALLDEANGGSIVPATVAELRDELRRAKSEGLDPHALWAVRDELPYDVQLSWLRHDARGSFDVLFKRRAAQEKTQGEDAGAVSFPLHTERDRDLSRHANHPLRGKFARQLAPQLRNFLREELPEYMIPSAFVLMEQMPLTAGGKVDLRALPAPDGVRPSSAQSFVAPHTLLEKRLAELWTTVLGVARIGVHDNFFELGGHSLLATQLISRLRQIFQVEIQLRQLFEHPTIDGLAKAIERTQSKLTVNEAQAIAPIARVGRRLTRTQVPRNTKQQSADTES